MSEERLRAAVASGVTGSETAYRALLQSIVEVARAIFAARASSVLLLDDARDAYLWRVEGASGAQPHPVQVPVTLTPWEAGPKLVADLVAAVHSGGPTACDVAEARRASAIGFAIHASSAAGGRRLALDEVDRELRVPSFPWGND